MKINRRKYPFNGLFSHCLFCQKKIQLLLVFFFLQFCVFGQQQDHVQFMAYNLLNYPDASANAADTALRNPHYRTILSSSNPDILVVEEMNSQFGVNVFLSNVLNATTSEYAAGTFLDGPDTDNGIFFKSSKFSFHGSRAIQTDLRTISEFTLVHILSGDTLRVYAVHLKASAGAANEAQRALEVDSLRKVTNVLPAGSNFIVCGDFNFYSSSESGYQKLLQVQALNEGHFIDPISMPGTWNSAGYSSHHTQSTRTRAFGGGSTGGMDDRFDLILFSKAIQQPGDITYVANSCIPFGNDGNHYNDSINKQPNTAVGIAVANALHNASDHLPVKAVFDFEYGSASVVVPDVGLSALVSPTLQMCSNPVQLIEVEVKNYGANAIDFATHPLVVTVHAINSSSVPSTLTKTISTGNISPGSSIPITFNSTLDMDLTGTYSFSGFTTLAGDTNLLNDSLATINVLVNSSQIASVSPAGPLMLCSGTLTLTASPGNAYSWSNGASTSSITVSDTGHYSVTVNYSGGCTSTSTPVQVYSGASFQAGTLFTESMGSVGAIVSIPNHELNNGFDMDVFSMSGSVDVRNTQSSAGTYSQASGGANVFLTNSLGKNFIISGINTSGMNNLQLSFGVYKSTANSTGSDLQVLVSADGVGYTALSFAALPTGSANWSYRNASGLIPSCPALFIQFKQNGTATQFRIDDVVLTYSTSQPSITSNGPLSFCQGDSLSLTASQGSFYLWNTGATTQSIVVHNSGAYSVLVDCISSDTTSVSSISCNFATLDIRLFFEGFYQGNQVMNSVADPLFQPMVCDTVRVSLAESISPNSIVAEVQGVIGIDGRGEFLFPSFVSGNSYYLVIQHRNSLETWSSIPVSFPGGMANYDFTTGVAQAYGNNLSDHNGTFCIYSGDVSNGTTSGQQDGIIESSDYAEVENSVQQFLSGYLVDDLTGDGIVESADYALVENNGQIFLSVMRP